MADHFNMTQTAGVFGQPSQQPLARAPGMPTEMAWHGSQGSADALAMAAAAASQAGMMAMFRGTQPEPHFASPLPNISAMAHAAGTHGHGFPSPLGPLGNMTNMPAFAGGQALPPSLPPYGSLHARVNSQADAFAFSQQQQQQQLPQLPHLPQVHMQETPVPAATGVTGPAASSGAGGTGGSAGGGAGSKRGRKPAAAAAPREPAAEAEESPAERAKRGPKYTPSEDLKVAKIMSEAAKQKMQHNASAGSKGHLSGAAFDNIVTELKTSYGLSDRTNDSITTRFENHIMPAMVRIREVERAGSGWASIYDLISDPKKFEEHCTKAKMPEWWSREIYNVLREISDDRPKYHPKRNQPIIDINRPAATSSGGVEMAEDTGAYGSAAATPSSTSVPAGNHTGVKRKATPSTRMSPVNVLLADIASKFDSSIKVKKEEDLTADTERRAAYQQMGELGSKFSDLVRMQAEQHEQQQLSNKVAAYEARLRAARQRIDSLRYMHQHGKVSDEKLAAAEDELLAILDEPVPK